MLSVGAFRARHSDGQVSGRLTELSLPSLRYNRSKTGWRREGCTLEVTQHQQSGYTTAATLSGLIESLICFSKRFFRTVYFLASEVSGPQGCFPFEWVEGYESYVPMLHYPTMDHDACALVQNLMLFRWLRTWIRDVIGGNSHMERDNIAGLRCITPSL